MTILTSLRNCYRNCKIISQVVVDMLCYCSNLQGKNHCSCGEWHYVCETQRAERLAREDVDRIIGYQSDGETSNEECGWRQSKSLGIYITNIGSIPRLVRLGRESWMLVN